MGKRTRKHSPQLDMTRHKDFSESGVKTEEGTLSKGVAKKDTRTRFGVEFMGKVGNNQGTHKQPKTRSLDGSGTLWNNFSNKEPRKRPTLGIRFIK